MLLPCPGGASVGVVITKKVSVENKQERFLSVAKSKPNHYKGATDTCKWRGKTLASKFRFILVLHLLLLFYLVGKAEKSFLRKSQSEIKLNESKRELLSLRSFYLHY